LFFNGFVHSFPVLNHPAARPMKEVADFARFRVSSPGGTTFGATTPVASKNQGQGPVRSATPVKSAEPNPITEHHESHVSPHRRRLDGVRRPETQFRPHLHR
jgi:hypothetical protein